MNQFSLNPIKTPNSEIKFPFDFLLNKLLPINRNKHYSDVTLYSNCPQFHFHLCFIHSQISSNCFSGLFHTFPKSMFCPFLSGVFNRHLLRLKVPPSEKLKDEQTENCSERTLMMNERMLLAHKNKLFTRSVYHS